MNKVGIWLAAVAGVGVVLLMWALVIMSASYEKKLGDITAIVLRQHSEWETEARKHAQCELSLERSIRETVACNDNLRQAEKDYSDKVHEVVECVQKFNAMFKGPQRR